MKNHFENPSMEGRLEYADMDIEHKTLWCEQFAIHIFVTNDLIFVYFYGCKHDGIPMCA